MIGIPGRNVIDNVPVYGKTVNGLVLVKVILTEKQRSESGLFLGDSSWAEAEHVTRHGIIMCVPDRLYYEKRDGFGLEWDTSIEVEVGDHVWFGIMAAYDCPVIKNGNDYFFILKYGDLICKKIGDDLVPLNGYVLASSITVTERSASFLVKEYKEKNKGIVKYVGSANKEYSHGAVDGLDILPGDNVVLLLPIFTLLEDSRYALLPSDLGYFQRRWIITTSR
jgi:co-chaperonin GroES (HSP10)